MQVKTTMPERNSFTYSCYSILLDIIFLYYWDHRFNW